jgi:hypothetical protein
MPTFLESVQELRDVAERLALGDAEPRKLRGLVVDLMDLMLGREPNHPDVNNSGARFAPPPPEKVGVGVVVPAVAVAPGTSAAAAASSADPAGADWLAQAQAEFEKRKAEEAAAAAAPASPAKAAKEDPKKAAPPNITPNGGH